MIKIVYKRGRVEKNFTSKAGFWNGVGTFNDAAAGSQTTIDTSNSINISIQFKHKRQVDGYIGENSDSRR